MTLHIYTARITYRGPDALDITRGTAEKARGAGLPRPPGEFLAPSAGLVFPTLRRLRAAKTEQERDRIFEVYAADYLGEIQTCYVRRTYEWDALYERPRVVFACFCSIAEALRGRCHRVLAGHDVARRGYAIYHGELTDPRPPCPVCDPDGGACDCGFRRPGEGPPPAHAQIDRDVDSEVAFSAPRATETARRPGLTRTRSPLPPKGTRS